MAGLKVLFPELLVIAAACAVLTADFALPRMKRGLIYLALTGLAAGILSSALLWVDIAGGSILGVQSAFYGRFTADEPGMFFKILILAATALVAMISRDYKPVQRRAGEFLALLLLSASAMMLLVSTFDMLMLFLSFEFVGITSFVLVGIAREDVKSGEAALKYFLVGTFSSAIMLYGLSLAFGLVHTTLLSRAQWPEGFPPALKMAVLLFLVGAGFKIAMVPFHQWAPEAYEGAPTPITGFISVVPKIAGFVVLLRTVWVGASMEVLDVKPLLAGAAAASMCLGNLAALKQENIKRMFAYSSIAQVGYMLVAVVAGTELGFKGLAVYLSGYLAMNLGAFAAIVLVSNKIGSDRIGDYRGLARGSLGLSLLLALFMMSLAGLPPTAGFVGKFLVFGSAIQAGWLWLAVLGVLNSVVSLFYYFRVVKAMFFDFSEGAPASGPVTMSPAASTALWLAVLMVLGIGLYPQPILALLG